MQGGKLHLQRPAYPPSYGQDGELIQPCGVPATGVWLKVVGDYFLEISDWEIGLSFVILYISPLLPTLDFSCCIAWDVFL